ncbi:MAG: hypothetical protein AAF791_03055 [Bacteroidota bacterium]
MPSATFLGVAFVIGAVASVAVAVLRGPTFAGTVAKATTVAFVLLAIAAFLL